MRNTAVNITVLLSIFCLNTNTYAESKVRVTLYKATTKGSGVGVVLGTLTFYPAHGGVVLVPNVQGLTAGLHGLHIHQKPSCQFGIKNGKRTAALEAGGHWDPNRTNTHAGPYHTRGHLGDLPALYADAQHQAIHPEFAPQLKIKDLSGHAIIVHQGGDNYSDYPAPLGGGGARIACGIISKKSEN